MKTLSFLSVLFFALLSTAHAQHGMIHGTVEQNHQKQPLAHAQVFVVAGAQVFNTYTDDAGYFKLENLPEGTFTLGVRYQGYEPLYIPKINVGASQRQIFDIHLEPEETFLEPTSDCSCVSLVPQD